MVTGATATPPTVTCVWDKPAPVVDCVNPVTHKVTGLPRETGFEDVIGAPAAFVAARITGGGASICITTGGITALLPGGISCTVAAPKPALGGICAVIRPPPPIWNVVGVKSTWSVHPATFSGTPTVGITAVPPAGVPGSAV